MTDTGQGKAGVSKILRIIRKRQAIPLLQATIELALARRSLMRITPERIARLNRNIILNPETEEANVVMAIERVTLAIRRGARLVPWRSDCLVQALAAQRWLAALNIQASIVVQVGRSENEEFLAHAALRYQDRCILGQSALPLKDIYAPSTGPIADQASGEG